MQKFILVMTMPSGSLWVLGPDPKAPGKNEGIALFPMKAGEENVIKGAWGFASESEAFRFMKEVSELSDEGARLMEKVRPMPAEPIQ
jgi:hypothetical protein